MWICVQVCRVPLHSRRSHKVVPAGEQPSAAITQHLNQPSLRSWQSADLRHYSGREIHARSYSTKQRSTNPIKQADGPSLESFEFTVISAAAVSPYAVKSVLMLSCRPTFYNQHLKCLNYKSVPLGLHISSSGFVTCFMLDDKLTNNMLKLL